MKRFLQPGLDDISPATIGLVNDIIQANQIMNLAKKERGAPAMMLLDPNSTDLSGMEEEKRTRRRGPKVAKDAPEPPSLTKSILNVLNGGKDSDSIERLAFETDPTQNNNYASIFRQKMRLIPDHILKRIAIQDDLVAAIINTRAAQVQSFGRPQPDRFSTGFKIVPDKTILQRMSGDEKKALNDRIAKLEKRLLTCGATTQWKDRELLTFPQFLGMATRNAVVVGRIAVELIYVKDASTGQERFHSFRPTDAGTIFQASPHKEAGDAVRKEALNLLEQLKNKDLTPEKFTKDEYAWVQVINGKPVQAFTENEMLVHNFYPVTDVELDGYPVTPIDTCISAVTTHINITTHNRLFFQSGRASKGMLVIQSDDVGEDTVTRVKHQFLASINNVGNSWRMPVFAVGKEDQITWQPIDQGGRDMEFQYLSDTNARVIMSAFQISPEELPGYQHLSRGTNNQALSESNNEYKLEAARDVGIRPLLAQFEDFLNARIMPLLDEKLSSFCVLKFVGLDAETPEKEAVRLQEGMGVYMTYDDVLQVVEKEPVGPQMGGQLPLNAIYSQKLDAYFTVGEILEYFCGKKGAAQDPMLQYRRDPFWFQQIQLQMQQQQMQMQQQQAMMGGGGGPPGGGGEGGPPQGDQQQQGGQGDLATGIDQVIQSMSKSEAQLPPSRRRLLAQHRHTVGRLMEQMDKDLASLNGEVLKEAGKHVRKSEFDWLLEG